MHACMRVLSCFRHVWLFATLRIVAHQVPLSVGFSRQEYWSGVPLPSPPDAWETTKISEVEETTCKTMILWVSSSKCFESIRFQMTHIMPLVTKSIILSFQNFPHSTFIITVTRYWPGSAEYTSSFLHVILANHLVWRHGNPLWYSCLEYPVDRGTWQAMVHRVAKSQTQLKWLSKQVLYLIKCKIAK